MTNFPPLKKDMYAILDEIIEAFPEIPALKTTMKTLGHEGIITLPLLEVGVKYEMIQRVKRRLNRKPFNPERAIDAFANLVLLMTVFFYMDDLQNIVRDKA